MRIGIAALGYKNTKRCNYFLTIVNRYGKANSMVNKNTIEGVLKLKSFAIYVKIFLTVQKKRIVLITIKILFNNIE
jgi:hypothetical protein